MKINQKQKVTLGSLLALKHRNAGQMERDGKTIEWGEADQIIVYPYMQLSGREWKMVISPSRREHILSKLEYASWGAFIQLEYDDFGVSDVDIIYSGPDAEVNL